MPRPSLRVPPPRHALPMPLLAGLCGIWLTLLLIGGLTHARTQAAALPPAQVDNSQGRGRLFLDERPALDLAGIFLADPQPSPDGRLLAVLGVPTGAQTADFARIYVLESATGRVVTTLSGHTPRWDPEDGRLAYVLARAGYGLYDPATGQVASTARPPALLAPLLIPEPAAPRIPFPTGPVAYPATIRVIHHASNGCRVGVPVGQVDVIPFEEYVARVTPNEMPALWPFHAVAAQAVASRTYGWYQILQNRPDWDVTDWANFQMMCDSRHPASDAAVAATAGIYLAAIGDPDLRPIVAMYSAENGHPTLTNAAVSYLQAVPDLFALGKVRNGHGFGLSQWGAYRRASAGHTYLQILGYYYTNVTVQNGLDPAYMAGALVDPAPPARPETTLFLPPSGLYWRAITPAAPISPSLTLTASAGLTESLVFSQTRGLWQPETPLAQGTVITAQFWLSGTEMDRRILVVDRVAPPAPMIVVPPTVTQRTVPVTVSVGENAARVGLGAGWLWQGEDLLHTPNSGRTVTDSGALNGLAWLAQAGVDAPGAWYGPYTGLLPADQAYRALFRLRAGTPVTTTVAGLVSDTVIARLDVTDKDGTVRLGLRDLRAADFLAGGGYVQIGVDFYLFQAAQGLEFRVDWRGNTDLAWDQVQIWRLPTADWQSGPLVWQIEGREGLHAIHALAFDGADNPSAPVSATLSAVDEAGPFFGTDFSPDGWQRTLPVIVSLSLWDELSGLDAASGLLHLSGSAGPISATLTRPDRPDLAQRIQAPVSALADGLYTASFQAGDRAGHTSMSPAFPLRIDVTPPTATAEITSAVAGAPLSITNGWHLAPVRLLLAGMDATSGLAQISYGVNGGSVQVYAEPVAFDSGGRYTVTYAAADVAGNVSPSQAVTLSIDLLSPTVTVTLDQGNPVLAVVRWSGQDDASGVARFEVESRLGSQAWLPVTPPPTGGDSSFVVEEGTILHVRVRAVDGAGRVGEWVIVSAVGAARQLYLPRVFR